MSKLQAALQGVKAPMVSTRELRQQQYKPATIYGGGANQTNFASQLTGIAGGVAQYAANYDAHREKTGVQRKNEIMLQNLKPEEMRKLREEGLLLYQDDPYAMRALDRTLGRQEAYSAESVIQERIAQGYYKSREEMEEERANVLESRMETMAESFGIDPKNRAWFSEGFYSDMDERSFAIYNAMDKKVDEYNRNNATVATDSEVSELIKSGNGQHVIQYLQRQVQHGVIRTEQDMEAHLVRGMKELSQQANSADLVNALADTEIELYGTKTTLRTRMGDEYIKTLVNQSAQASLNNNWKSQQWFMNQLYFLQSPDFTQPDAIEKGLDAIRDLENFANLSQGDAATAARIQIEQAKAQFDKLHREFNTKQTAEITKQQQQKVRISVLDAAVNGRLTGDTTHSLKLSAFEETASTGKFDTNDWNAYYSFKTDEIDKGDGSPEQKALKKLQLGVLLKDIPDSGFGAHYQEHFTRVTSEVSKYAAALDAGAELPETPQLDKMMEFYNASPELFSQTFGPDFPMANAIAVSATMGIHPSVMIQGQKRLDEMRKSAPEQARQIQLEAGNMENNRGANVYQNLNTEQREAITALYLGLEGYTNSEKIRVIGEHLEKQYSTVEGATGVIPKSFLMSDPQDLKSVSVGQTRLSAAIKQRFPAGTTTVRVTGNRLIVYGSIGGAPMVFTKEMLMAD
ncbi:internal virion protein [Aeromonas phage JELG-KS1]|uniref:Internal virion protein n=1 Tax=Aeromonas phage JELG-KS1 TaxID=2951233 RepID=A0A9E7T414_9CAUD|nr:internal virion protein [Aeromonas phage JELG-KS1]